MSFQQYLKRFIFLSILWISIIPLSNWIIDPYGIFETHFLKYSFQQNERFIKIEHLKKEHPHFNGYIFGSSRIGVLTPALLNKYIDGASFYNMYGSGANQWDTLKHLEYMLRNKYTIKNIYLQVDLEPAFGPSNKNLLKIHPEVVNESLIQFYLHNLVLFPYSDLKKTIKNNFKANNTALYNWTDGSYSRPRLEREIEENHSKYINTVSDFHKTSLRKKAFSKQDREQIDQNIAAILKIIRLSEDNDFKLFLFTSPLNQHKLDTINIDMYLYYLSKLAKITNFWDFGGYNKITTDDKLYYEASHYRPLVNKMIAESIFKGNQENKTNGFGVYVHSKNINNHLSNIQHQMHSR